MSYIDVQCGSAMEGGLVIVAVLTVVAVLSVTALYAHEMHQTKVRRTADPVRSGLEPEFARLGEHDWYEKTLTSTEWARN